MKRLGVVFSGNCTDISGIVKDLAVGIYSFNKPVTAYVDDPFHITLVLKTDLKQEVTYYFTQLAGEVTSREGKFSQSVSAKLTADDLTVSPIEPQSKIVTGEEPVVWDWTITPKSAGKRTLIIEVVANIQIGTDKQPVTVRAIREAITIEVSYLHKVKMYVAAFNGYVLAASATVTAVAGVISFAPAVRKALIRFFRRRRRKALHPQALQPK